MEEIQSTAGAIPVRNEKGNNKNCITPLYLQQQLTLFFTGF